MDLLSGCPAAVAVAVVVVLADVAVAPHIAPHYLAGAGLLALALEKDVVCWVTGPMEGQSRSWAVAQELAQQVTRSEAHLEAGSLVHLRAPGTNTTRPMDSGPQRDRRFYCHRRQRLLQTRVHLDPA